MIGECKVLCVITARANSRGCPGKNYKEINGRPLVQWSILHSIACSSVDLTIVSSNCTGVKKATEDLQKEIDNSWEEDIGRLYGFREWPIGEFKFLQRPDELATPTSKNEEALIHAYKHSIDWTDQDFDTIVNLQPTSPVRSIGLLGMCLKQFIKEESDSLFTASKHTPFFFKKVNGEVIADWDIQNRPMRQEINADSWLWHDAGNVYITKRDLLLRTKCRLGGKISMFELLPEESLQIDTELDFKIVETIMKEKAE